ncbi:MAG: glycosyl transferase group 1 [uncultured bacterium]|nr:MAG: glycosyl transferase group 1 [uncultured bacterium]
MNIGIDLRGILEKNKTGVGEYTLNLIKAVLEQDKTNRYFLFTNSIKKTTKPPFYQNNVFCVHTHYPNKILNLALTLGLIKIENLLPEKINYWFSPNLNFTSLKKSTKHILLLHDLSFEFFPEFYTLKRQLWHRFINPKKLCETADIIITPSVNTKRDLINYYQIPDKKIQVIYPGLSKNFYIDEEELKKQKNFIKKKYGLPDNFILFLAAIEPRKNLLGLIKAYEKLPPTITNKYHLIIAGAKGWKNNSVYKAALHSSLKQNIKFFGYLPDLEKPALYSLADLFVFPSYYEGFGLPIIEAMQMNTPVIASNCSSINEIAKNGVLLVNPNNTNNLSVAIKTILQNPELIINYKKRGKEIASEFNWHEAAALWLRLLESD